MASRKKITAGDCETDPFLHEREPVPFIWGHTDGTTFRTFRTTREFVDFIKTQDIIVYFHNGGKFDVMFLLPFIEGITKVQIINGRIISLMLGKAQLIDSYAAVPESLARIKKRSIEMWKLEADVREKYMDEIIHYLEGDCIYLLELMVAYRKAAGTQKTIASNALAFAKKIGIQPGKTNHRFDANYRPFFFGGRTECFRSGTHENVDVFDIKSCYPFAMMHEHPSGDDMHRRKDFGNLTREEIQRSFIVLQCYSDGAFPLRALNSEGLSFPRAHSRDVSKDGTYKITGWEYIAAKDLGLIDDEKILEVRYTTGVITFRDYVMHWYKYKNDHPKKTDPINYTIGKIMMNSLYGKMAQNPARYFDYKIMPIGSPLPCNLPCEKPAIGDDGFCRICGIKSSEHISWDRIFNRLDECLVCGVKKDDHGWLDYSNFQGHAFHRRESLWKYKYRWGEGWEAKPLYKNVATGASITGFARAYLLRHIHQIGIEHIIYCDTDSMVVDQFADTSCLKISDTIGDWELEIKKAPIAHFSGKKQYAIEKDPSKPCKCANTEMACERHKVVSKGARLTFKDVEKLIEGEIIEYKSAAPTFSIANGVNFVVRNMRRTA